MVTGNASTIQRITFLGQIAALSSSRLCFKTVQRHKTKLHGWFLPARVGGSSTSCFRGAGGLSDPDLIEPGRDARCSPLPPSPARSFPPSQSPTHPPSLPPSLPRFLAFALSLTCGFCLCLLISALGADTESEQIPPKSAARMSLRQRDMQREREREREQGNSAEKARGRTFIGS